jgi:small conductance mechanosensitive channel
VEDEEQPAWQDVLEWVVAGPLQILLIVVVAIIARWITHRAINRVVRTTAVGARAHERPGADRRIAITGGLSAGQLLTERRAQRAETLGSILRSTSTAFIFGLAFVLVLGELGIDLAPIVASAGIAGVALGFGAQTLVKDFLSGVFMIVEDQYGVGDVIDTGFATGTVEEVGLRITQVRDVNGVVWYVRNGEILRVGNRSQGWALATVDVPVSYDQDLDVVRRLVGEVGQDMVADADLRDRILDPPIVAGVEAVAGDAITVRVTCRVVPQESLTVSRQLRERLKAAFDEAGVRVPVLARPFPPGQSPGSPGAAGPT